MDRWCYRGSMDSKESRDERISNTYHVCLSQAPECTDVIVIKLYVLITLLSLKHPDECLNTKANCITNNHRLFLVWAYLDCRFSSSKGKRVKNKINQLTLFLTPWMQGICNQNKDNTFFFLCHLVNPLETFEFQVIYLNQSIILYITPKQNQNNSLFVIRLIALITTPI